MRGSILEALRRIKEVFSGDLFLVMLVVLVGLASFGLGHLSGKAQKHEPVRIETGAVDSAAAVAAFTEDREESPASLAGAGAGQGNFVGSKNSDKYHFPWCSGAQRIKPENKVWFQTREEAERAGYTPAANCEGL